MDRLCAASVITRPGERAVIRQVREFIYPTEYDPPEIPTTIGIGGIGGGLLAILLAIIFWPLAILVLIAIGLVALAIYIAPLVAFIMCFAKPDEPFRFPFIWRLIGS